MNTRPRSQAPKGFIFDLDGTLIDSFADIASALNGTRSRFGHLPLPRDEITRHVGSGSEYLVRQLVPVPEDRFQEAYRHYLRSYEEKALQETDLYPGVRELLARFAGRPLAVVTNKTQHLSEKILAGLGLAETFRVVLGGDALERSKPDPLPLLHVLETFSLPPESVAMVGDALHDVHAGQAAGVITVAVTTGVADKNALAAAHPDFLIDRLEQILDCFAFDGRER